MPLLIRRSAVVSCRGSRSRKSAALIKVTREPWPGLESSLPWKIVSQTLTQDVCWGFAKTVINENGILFIDVIIIKPGSQCYSILIYQVVLLYRGNKTAMIKYAFLFIITMFRCSS